MPTDHDLQSEMRFPNYLGFFRQNVELKKGPFDTCQLPGNDRKKLRIKFFQHKAHAPTF